EGLLDATRGGVIGFAFVEGEPGIGKTRLLEEGRLLAARYGYSVLAGQARELDQGRPFGALSEALGLRPTSRDAERRRIGRLLLGDPESGEHPTGPDYRFRLVEEITDFVERRTRDRPLLLVLDDVHWIDP